MIGWGLPGCGAASPPSSSAHWRASATFWRARARRTAHPRPTTPRVPIYGLANDALPGDTGETAGGHWCGYDDWDFADAVNPDLLGVTRCAILPPGFVLAR